MNTTTENKGNKGKTELVCFSLDTDFVLFFMHIGLFDSCSSSSSSSLPFRYIRSAGVGVCACLFSIEEEDMEEGWRAALATELWKRERNTSFPSSFFASNYRDPSSPPVIFPAPQQEACRETRLMLARKRGRCI